MLVVYILMSVFYKVGQCQIILPPCLGNDHQLIFCVTDVLDNYFSEYRELTYVNMEIDDEELLKTIHTMQNFSLITRNETHQSFMPNLGYLITSKNMTIFTKYFKYLLTDPTWNPYARFLIIIKSLQNDELRGIFDVLLRAHVINVLVVNGTIDAHLFTYNPFDNYACGKYYTDVISLGLCSQSTNNLYPYKLVTGLKNCTFRASVAHRPPFGIHPSENDEKPILGAEETILKILSERGQFTVITYYNYNANQFSSVTANMTAIGQLGMLQNNETDVIYGGMMVVLPRVQGFSSLGGYHDYTDEVRIVVKSTTLVPIWKTMYIAFDFAVWMFLLLSLIVYSLMMIFLLQAKDKSRVVLELLDNLLGHSRDLRCRMSLKGFLITWVWFAYLVNTYYTASLCSLTTNPSKEYQVSKEEDLVKYNYKPCFSVALRNLLLSDSSKGLFMKLITDARIRETEGCHNGHETIMTVSKNKNMYLLAPISYNSYHKQDYTDKWGNCMLYYFEKTIKRYMYAYFFYKGFPITPDLKLNVLRIRENGLADKCLNDVYFKRTLKQRYSEKEFEVRFILPWSVYLVGCIISAFTFLTEYFLNKIDKQIVDIAS